jgi:hypothetical protein
MGSGAYSWLVHEVRQMLPPTIFFILCLNLIVLTVTLLSDDHELSAVSHASACIGALLIGKAFLLADKLPLMNWLRDRPLIIGALWSSLVYFVIVFILHLAERMLSAATDSKGFLFMAKADIAGFDWSLFLVVQLWFALLLIVYSVIRAAVRSIGPARIREILLVETAASDP